jgi:hypothetical protein
MEPTRRQFLLLTGASALAVAGCSDDPPAAASDAAASDAPSADVPPDELTLPDVSESPDAPTAVLDAGPADAPVPEDASLPSDTGPSIGAYRYPEDTARFPYGVMAGDMLDDRAILWTYSPVYTHRR